MAEPVNEPTWCATGCSAPAVGRIGNEPLCSKCIDSMESQPNSARLVALRGEAGQNKETQQ